MAKPKLPSHPHSHPLYVPGLLSTAQISSLDWSKIINEPTTRDGYGITDVYLSSEVDALIADFLTATTADALFLTPAEGDAAYSALGHTHTFASLTSKPTTLAGYGITDAYTDADVDALLAALALDDLADVVITTVADGDVLTWDSGTSKWVNEAPTPGGAFDLDDAGDVVITTPADGDVLTYDSGSGDWINSPASGGTIDGTGSAIRHAYWTDSDTLAASVMLETNSVGTEVGVSFAPDDERVAISMQAANVTPGQSVDNPGWTLRADTTGNFELLNNWGGDKPWYATPENEVFLLGPVTIENTSASMRLRQSGAATDEKLWEFQADSGSLKFTAVNDAVSAADVWLQVERTGDDADMATFNVPLHLNDQVFFNAPAGSDYGTVMGSFAANNFQLRTNDDGASGQVDATKESWALVLGEGTAHRFVIYQRPAGGSFGEKFFVSKDGHIQTYGMVTPNIADTFTFDGDTLPHYGTTFFNDSRSGFTAMSLAGYGGFSIFTQGAERLRITQAGGFLFDGPVVAATDNTYDFGASGATRFRTGYFGTSIVVPTVNATTALQVNSITRINTTRPTYAAPTATQARTAVATGESLATLVTHVAAIVADLRSIGIFA